jgi:hypothetical protein
MVTPAMSRVSIYAEAASIGKAVVVLVMTIRHCVFGAFRLVRLSCRHWDGVPTE